MLGISSFEQQESDELEDECQNMVLDKIYGEINDLIAKDNEALMKQD